MGFFSKVGGFFKKVGSGIGKAFGVVTAPIKEVWGVVKDSVQTIVHMPEKVLKSFDKATSVVGGLGNNIERSVGSAAGAVTSVADGAAQISEMPATSAATRKTSLKVRSCGRRSASAPSWCSVHKAWRPSFCEPYIRSR